MLTLLSNCATIADFELYFGTQETIELSDLCDPLNTVINTDKIQLALDMAHDTLNGYYAVASDCGRAMIKLNCKRMVMVIARSILDTTKSRPNVQEDLEFVLNQIKEFCSCDNSRCPLSPSDLKDILGDDYQSNRATYRGYPGIGRRIQEIPDRSFVDRYSNYINFNTRADDYTIDQN